MFLKKKHDGNAKGRECTAGEKQHNIFQNKDATSPIVALELVPITSDIDGKKLGMCPL